MKKVLCFFAIFIILIFSFGCASITDNGIEGTWLVTYHWSIPQWDSYYYYKFSSDGKFYYSSNKNSLHDPVYDNYGSEIQSQSPSYYGKYSISGGKLNLEYAGERSTDSYTAYYNSTTLYWYNNIYNVEEYRLSRQ